MAREKIGELIVRMGYATPREVGAALREQRARGGAPRVGELLVEQGSCDGEQVAKAVATQAGMKYCVISKFRIPAEVVACVPEDVARSAFVVPLKRGKRALIVAAESPFDFFKLDDLRFQLGTEVEAVISSAAEIQAAIDRYYGRRAGRRSEDELRFASSRGLLRGALSTLEGEIRIELRDGSLRLAGARAGMLVRHELELSGDLQARVLTSLQLDASTLAAARTGWRTVSLVREGHPVDLLLRAFPVPGGHSLTLRRL